MAWNLKQNDDGTAEFEATGQSVNTEFFVNFNGTQKVGFGRGSTDTDNTYLLLQDNTGTNQYLYTTDGLSVTLTTARP